jgi:hypothetical protein
MQTPTMNYYARDLKKSPTNLWELRPWCLFGETFGALAVSFSRGRSTPVVTLLTSDAMESPKCTNRLWGTLIIRRRAPELDP